jgi:hypothetical protein
MTIATAYRTERRVLLRRATGLAVTFAAAP